MSVSEQSSQERFDFESAISSGSGSNANCFLIRPLTILFHKGSM